MFGFDKLKKMIDGVNLRVNNAHDIISNMQTAVDCKECGCTIKSHLAINGKSEIGGGYWGEPEYIYTPYYCKRCHKEKFQKPCSPSGLNDANEIRPSEWNDVTHDTKSEAKVIGFPKKKKKK